MIDVDKTTFEEEVLKADGYVFVVFKDVNFNLSP